MDSHFHGNDRGEYGNDRGGGGNDKKKRGNDMREVEKTASLFITRLPQTIFN